MNVFIYCVFVNYTYTMFAKKMVGGYTLHQNYMNHVQSSAYNNSVMYHCTCYDGVDIHALPGHC